MNIGAICTLGHTNGDPATGVGAIYAYAGGIIQNCSIIRGGGLTNAVCTVATATWISVWTNNLSANCLATFSTSLNNYTHCSVPSRLPFSGNFIIERYSYK